MRFQSITTQEARPRSHAALRKLGAILIGSFLTIGIVLCFSFVSGTSNHFVTEVPGHACSSFEGSSSCTSISEHISYWQAVSMAVFTDDFLLVLVSAMLLFLWTSHRSRFIQKGYVLFHFTKSSINLDLVLPRNSLQEAFATGAIHGKAF